MRLHSWGLILMAKLKKLVPGETLLGPIEDAIKREKGKNVTGPQTALLFYGNLIVDSEDPNKRYHIKPVESYYAFLENFLNSPEGQKYERPTKEEIDAAIAACVSSKKTDENSASVEPAGEENVPDPENEPTLKNDGSNQEPPDPEESDAEKEKPGKPKKRQFGRKSNKKELVTLLDKLRLTSGVFFFWWNLILQSGMKIGIISVSLFIILNVIGFISYLIKIRNCKI